MRVQHARNTGRHDLPSCLVLRKIVSITTTNETDAHTRARAQTESETSNRLRIDAYACRRKPSIRWRLPLIFDARTTRSLFVLTPFSFSPHSFDVWQKPRCDRALHTCTILVMASTMRLVCPIRCVNRLAVCARSRCFFFSVRIYAKLLTLINGAVLVSWDSLDHLCRVCERVREKCVS